MHPKNRLHLVSHSHNFSVSTELLRRLEANAGKVIAEVSLNAKEVYDRIAIRDLDHEFLFEELPAATLQEIIDTNSAALRLVSSIYEAADNGTVNATRTRVQSGEMITKFFRRFCLAHIAMGNDVMTLVESSQELGMAGTVTAWMEKMQDRVRPNKNPPVLLN